MRTRSEWRCKDCGNHIILHVPPKTTPCCQHIGRRALKPTVMERVESLHLQLAGTGTAADNAVESAGKQAEAALRQQPAPRPDTALGGVRHGSR